MLSPLRLALLACLLLSAAGCGKAEAVNFNNALAAASKKLTAAGQALREAVEKAETDKADAAAARAAYNAAVATLAEVKKEVSALAVPSSKSARDLAEGYHRFLAGQEESLNKEYHEIVTLLEDRKVPPPKRRSRFNELQRAALDRETAAMTELRGLQSAFAKDNDITLKSGK